jgi:hypothetical protein
LPLACAAVGLWDSDRLFLMHGDIVNKAAVDAVDIDVAVRPLPEELDTFILLGQWKGLDPMRPFGENGVRRIGNIE